MRKLVGLVTLTVLLLAGSSSGADSPHLLPHFRPPESPRPPGQAVLTPEQFGAEGDGRSDDTAAIQRALDVAARRHARVRLAAGTTYLCDGAVDLPSGSYLYGAGRGSVLKFSWTENGPHTDGYYLGNQDQQTGNHDIVLDNFAIVGAGSGRPSGPKAIRHLPRVPGIRFRLVERFELTQLDVSRVAGISVLYQGSSEGLIADNHVHHSGRDGITGTWHGRNLEHILVRDNLIERVGDDGIALVGAPGQRPNRAELPTDLVVRDNRVLGWQRNRNGLLLGRGIVVLAARRVLIRDNVVDRTHSYGILISGSTRDFSRDPRTGEKWRSSHITVARNRVEDAAQNLPGSRPVAVIGGGRDGVRVTSSDDVDVVDNTIVNSYGRDLVFVDCHRCTAEAAGD